MYASVWKRFFAFMIDAAVFALLFWVLAQLMDNASVTLVLLVLIWLYYALLESSPLQASVGKILMGIKVVDRRGRRLSFWQATERIISKLVTNVTFYFGFFIAAFDKQKRTLHDRLSHSAVILKNAEFDPLRGGGRGRIADVYHRSVHFAGTGVCGADVSLGGTAAIPKNGAARAAFARAHRARPNGPPTVKRFPTARRGSARVAARLSPVQKNQPAKTLLQRV